jgi:creatinine amidohydrolase
MSGRPYVLRETTWQVVRQTAWDVAILPWGATEAHNFHLPYGTDTYQAEAIAIEAARLSWEKGARVTVLPSIPFGVNTGQLDIPLTINLNPSSQLPILRDIADSLLSCGIPRLVLLNGHGGYDFRPAVRELQGTHPLLIVAVNWWQIGHLEADLVLPLAVAGNGAVRPPRITALRQGWAWTPRRWTQVSNDTGVGDPSGATAEAGQRYFQSITAQLAQLMVELAGCPTDQLYTDAKTGEHG